jgi:hypothetical protein
VPHLVKSVQHLLSIKRAPPSLSAAPVSDEKAPATTATSSTETVPHAHVTNATSVPVIPSSKRSQRKLLRDVPKYIDKDDTIGHKLLLAKLMDVLAALCKPTTTNQTC